jgi:antitoxin component YwqK of YwqJK toxin-antitoxin module
MASEKKSKNAEIETIYHKDGSLWAKGPMSNGVPVGYWEWFRKDGKKLRSGYFDNGEQIGEWTTYKNGVAHKVTQIKPKPAVKKTKSSASTKTAGTVRSGRKTK